MVTRPKKSAVPSARPKRSAAPVSTTTQESTHTRQDMITMLTQSVHGDIAAYQAPVIQAAQADPDFFAHLIAWNQRKGTVRDARLALPLLSLQVGSTHLTPAYRENALAHLALSSPRQLLKAVEYVQKTGFHPKAGFFKTITRYLRAREMFPAWWMATALQHRESLKRLYKFTKTCPSVQAQRVLFEKGYPDDSVFFAVQHLANYPTAQEIGGVIARFKIPFLVARGALGARLKEPDVLLAVIDRMTPTELVTNAKALQKLGVSQQAATSGAMTQGLKRARKSKVNVLKTTEAVKAIAHGGDDEQLVAQLEDLQERQLERTIDGNWLVLADKSSSMQHAIETARQITGVLTRLVSGQVHLVFFDGAPRYFDVTGKTYQDITKLTQSIHAGGQTSIGCGLSCAVEKKCAFDGIALISDGGENGQPRFTAVYTRTFGKSDVQPPVYFYQLPGDRDSLSVDMRNAGIDFQAFDLTQTKLDYYSLPTLVQTMSVKRYSLVQSIYDTPLLTIPQALRVPRQFRDAAAVD